MNSQPQQRISESTVQNRSTSSVNTLEQVVADCTCSWTAALRGRNQSS